MILDARCEAVGTPYRGPEASACAEPPIEYEAAPERAKGPSVMFQAVFVLAAMAFASICGLGILFGAGWLFDATHPRTAYGYSARAVEVGGLQAKLALPANDTPWTPPPCVERLERFFCSQDRGTVEIEGSRSTCPPDYSPNRLVLGTAMWVWEARCTLWGVGEYEYPKNSNITVTEAQR